MALRFTETAGRIVMSKPGYDASTSLPDAFKIFDSDWGFSGVIITRGSVSLPSGLQEYVIPIPPQHYVPTAEVGYFDSSGNLVSYIGGYMTNSALVLQVNDYDPNDNSGRTLPAGLYRYVVYGISQ